MLGGLKLLLDAFRLFADASDRRLPALLEKSREAQAAVSSALAEQVLGALHELLRGLDAAAPDLVRDLASSHAAHLYEGLLTVLMRLVFVLYAEDRDLLPSRPDGRAQSIYEIGYSVRGLYDRLTNDAALNPDTMDERRGGWGQLLTLFRLIHKGHPSHFIQGRGGKLFDPEQFTFLEGRVASGDAPSALPVSDGCILRILEGLMTLAVKGGTRERLSYRTLDVEQIGSVYETVMGLRAEQTEGPSLAIKAGKNNHTPVFVDLRALLVAKGKDRIKYLKEEADRGQLSAGIGNAVQAAKTVAELAAALDGIVDERGSPKKHPIAAGTPILQPTDERRRTGSHYTPRSLTAPIVEHALAPAFERLGPDATPEQILDLKVCDPAMGSGAFLVEACRALAARLVRAWARHPEKKPKNIPPDEDEELHAKRLVAQRCLYGVDKNPLATDLAKLSLWLATLARDHEFTFLDHALKSGDSLVGLTQAQIAAAHWDASKPGLPLFRKLVKDRVDEAMMGRAEIQEAPDDTARAIQESRHRSLEVRLKDIRLIGDAVIAAFFAADKPRAREKKRAEVESWLTGPLEAAWDNLTAMAATLKQGEHPLNGFHWEIEFPEVFARINPGFDAVVGNPPFLGGSKISTTLSKPYLTYLKAAFVNCGGRTDLVVYFVRRAYDAIRKRGTLGLIATKTIAQGDSRRGGLQVLIGRDGTIYSAMRRIKWPGVAAVTVSVIHVCKGIAGTEASLDGIPVDFINSFLLPSRIVSEPEALSSNRGIVFTGVMPYGQGFFFEDGNENATPLSVLRDLEQNRHNSDVVFPFLGGDEILSQPEPITSRFVINFGERSLENAREWPDLLEIVERKVRPERVGKAKDVAAWPWWRFWRPRREMLEATAHLSQFLVKPHLSSYHALTFLPHRFLPSHNVSVFALEGYGGFVVLQSRVHEEWVRLTSSSLEERQGYRADDCFETFPFPRAWAENSEFESIGKVYHEFRTACMIRGGEGLTKTYGRFHDPDEHHPDITKLRDLHAAMDRSVLDAYGWRDLPIECHFLLDYEVDEEEQDNTKRPWRYRWSDEVRDEVLARLLTLNVERHAEEVRLGTAPGMKREVEDEGDDDAGAG